MKRLTKFALVSSMIISIAVLAGCTQSPTESTTSSSANTSTSTEASSQPPTESEAAQPGMVSCEYLPDQAAAKPVDLPATSSVPATGTVTFTMHMDAGDVVMTLDRSKAPCTVNSFASLANQKYFDDTHCHRFVADFVLQCGDPTETGSGGPGYSFNDELTGTETYPYGTLAMANAGPNTNGSQFFIVIGQSVQLPPSYTVFGTVSPESMSSTIESIASQGGVDPSNPNGSAPAEGGHIVDVTQS